MLFAGEASYGAALLAKSGWQQWQLKQTPQQAQLLKA